MGSPTSRLACYAYMFDKNGCTKDDCEYSHKDSIIKKYKADKKAEAKKKKKAEESDDDDE